MEARLQTIQEVRAEAVVCCRCNLCYSRTLVVFGEGPAPAELMIVGEGPGADEDACGQPFVGKSGRLLDRLLAEAGLSRDEIWVTNIVLCRPADVTETGPRNRAPKPDEIRACDLWMSQEVRLVSPQAILCLGGISAQSMISSKLKIGETRGKWYTGRHGIPLTATHHPALRYRKRGQLEIAEAELLDDLRMVRRWLESGTCQRTGPELHSDREVQQ